MGNWNKCLDYASGVYIKFLCADDKFHPDLLQKFVAVMDQHPSVSIVNSYNEIFGLASYLRVPPFTGLVSGNTAKENILAEGGKNWLYAPSAVMFRKEAIYRIGKFHPQLLRLTDLEYYLRLLSIGDCYVVPERLSYIRVHGNTQSAIIKTKPKRDIFEQYHYMTYVKKASGSEGPSIQKLIDLKIHKRAIRVAAIMYEVLPKLYKKQNRIIFKEAFQIGRSEGVLFAPISYYLKGKYFKKLLQKPKPINF